MYIELMASDKKSQIEFVMIGQESALLQRAKKFCEEYQHEFANVDSVDAFSENDQLFVTNFVMFSAVSFSREGDISGAVQVIKQMAPEAFVLVVADKRLKPESAVFIKKSGANLVLLEDEVVSTSKLEFVASLKIKNSFLPMKAVELTKNTAPDFTLYHVLPLARKMIPVFSAGQPISESKLEKVKTVGEVYFKSDDVEKYKAYIDKYLDKSALGLAARCRAQFLELSAAFLDLVLLIIDQSEQNSYDTGKELFERCSRLCSDLMMSLGAIGDAWSIINNSAFGEFGSVERGPATAAYAGLYSLMADLGKQDDVVMAALLSDIGLLEMSPRCYSLLKKNQPLDAESKSEYEKHPILTVNKVLSRKIPLPESVKNIILCTHERADGKGFPQARPNEKIPLEAYLVQLAEQMDRESLIDWGKARKSSEDVQREVFRREFESQKKISLSVLSMLKPILDP